MIERVSLVALLALAACQAGPDDRQRTLAAAGRADSALAGGTVVRDLRSPPDSTRILYTRPTPLALPVATAAGAGPVTAPYGVSTPDTAGAGARPRPAPGPGQPPPRGH